MTGRQLQTLKRVIPSHADIVVHKDCISWTDEDACFCLYAEDILAVHLVDDGLIFILWDESRPRFVRW